MSESRTKKSVKNITTAFIAKLLVLILGLVSRTIFLKCLSVDYLGVNGLFTNILTILSFAELGIGNAIQFHMYKPIKENNYEKSVGLLLLYKKAYNIVFLTVLVIGLAITPFIHYLIKTQPAINEDIKLIFVLYVINSAASYLFVYKQTVLVADQNAYIINIANSATTIITNILHISILLLTSNYILYLLSTTICTVTINGFLSLYIDRRYKWIKTTNKTKISQEYRKEIFKDVQDLTVSKVAGVACNGTDNIIISKMISVTSVGLASNYTLIINSASGIINAAISSLTGSIGNFNSGASIVQKNKVFHEIFLMNYLVYSFACIGLLSLSSSFVSLMWGEDLVLPFPTVLFLILIVFQSGMNFPAYTFRITMGFFEKMKCVYIITAVLNIGLSIALAIPFGMTGVFAATVISKALTSELGDGYYAYKYGCGKNLIAYVLLYLRYFLYGSVTTTIVLLISKKIVVTGVLSFLLKGAVAACLIIICDIVFFYRTKEFRDLIQRVKVKRA